MVTLIGRRNSRHAFSVCVGMGAGSRGMGMGREESRAHRRFLKQPLADAWNRQRTMCRACQLHAPRRYTRSFFKKGGAYDIVCCYWIAYCSISTSDSALVSNSFGPSVDSRLRLKEHLYRSSLQVRILLKQPILSALKLLMVTLITSVDSPEVSLTLASLHFNSAVLLSES